MKYAHPYTKTAQGVLMDWSDDLPREAFVALDNALSLATDAAKDVEAERDAAVARVEKLRAAMDEANGHLAEARGWTADEAKDLIDEAIDSLTNALLAADDAERGVG